MPPKPARSELQFRTVRLATFTDGTNVGSSKTRKKWKHPTLTSDHMADSGFYYTPTKAHPEQVTCHWCEEKECNYGEIKSICEFHHKNHPTCSYSKITMFLEGFVKSSNKGKYWQKLGNSTGKEITDPMSFDSYLLRLSTFKEWWKFDKSIGTKVTSKGLAEAGFYYSPVEIDDDRVICMYCDCPLSDWALEDDPLAEHSKNSFEYCYFLESHREDEKVRKNRAKIPERTSKLKSISSSPKSARGTPVLDEAPIDKDVKLAEKDAFDFSIEELENYENGTIFKGKDMLPKRFSRKRNKEISNFSLTEPKPKRQATKVFASANEKSTPEKIRKKLESLKRTVQEEIDRALRDLSADEVVEDNDDVNSDKTTSKSGDKNSESGKLTDENEASEDSAEEERNNDGDNFSETVSEFSSDSDTGGENDSDASYGASETSSRLSTKRNISKQPNTPIKKRRNILVTRSHVSQFDDDDDFGINEAELQKILNSPKKARKVKVIQKSEPISPSGSLYDNSNQNLGDYDEANLSFLEKNVKPVQLAHAKAEKVVVGNMSKVAILHDTESELQQPVKDGLEKKVEREVQQPNELEAQHSAEHTLANEAKEELEAGNKSSMNRNESISTNTSEPPGKNEETDSKNRVLPSEMSLLEVLAPYSDVKTEMIPSSFGPDTIESIEKLGVDTDPPRLEDPLSNSVPEEVKEDSDLTSSDNDKFHTTEMNIDDHSQSTMSADKADPIAAESDLDEEVISSHYKPEVTSNNQMGANENKDECEAERDKHEHRIGIEEKETIIEEKVPTENEQNDKEMTPEQLTTSESISLQTKKEVNLKTDIKPIDSTTNKELLDASTLTSQLPAEQNFDHHMTTDSIVLETSPIKTSIEPPQKLEIELKQTNLDQDPLLVPHEDEENHAITKTPSKSPNDDNEQGFTVSPSSYRDYKKDLEEMDIEFVDDVILKDTTRNKAVDPSMEIQSETIGKEPSMKSKEDSYVVNDSASEPVPVQSSLLEVGKGEVAQFEKPLTHVNVEVHARDIEVSNKKLLVMNGEVHSLDRKLTVTSINDPSPKAPAINETSPSSEEIKASTTKQISKNPISPELVDDKTPSVQTNEEHNKEKSPSPPSRISTKPLGDASDLHEKTENSLSRLSFDNVEASTPQKTTLASVAPVSRNDDAITASNNERKFFPRISLDFAYSQVKALEEAIERMSELSSTKFDLHNDADGYLTEFIAAMPEKEESMTIQDWILENAASCEQTAATICSQIINSYLEDFDKFIRHVENMATID